MKLNNCEFLAIFECVITHGKIHIFSTSPAIAAERSGTPALPAVPPSSLSLPDGRSGRL